MPYGDPVRSKLLGWLLPCYILSRGESCRLIVTVGKGNTSPELGGRAQWVASAGGNDGLKGSILRE
jgi:hypothetical protein